MKWATVAFVVGVTGILVAAAVTVFGTSHLVGKP
jgi:hypothetical protein